MQKGTNNFPTFRKKTRMSEDVKVAWMAMYGFIASKYFMA
jgi:hypothetical protein